MILTIPCTRAEPRMGIERVSMGVVFVLFAWDIFDVCCSSSPAQACMQELFSKAGDKSLPSDGALQHQME